MKKYRLAAYLTAATVLFTGCTSDTVSSSTEQNGGANVAEGQTNKAVTDMNNTTVTNATLPEELSPIPQEHFSDSDEPGTLVELEYDTYESMTYDQKATVLLKRAIVYLPYGHSDDTACNVFYRTAA